MLIISSAITLQLIHLSYSTNLRNKNVYRTIKWILTYVVFAPLVFLCVIVNTAPAALVMYSWITGSVNVFGVTYIFNVLKSDNSIIMNSINSSALNDSKVADQLNEYEAFAKLVMVFFTVSSALSFIMFIYALVCTYKCAGVRNIWRERTRNGQQEPEPNPLDPFQYNGSDTSTKIDLPESLYFNSLFLLNIVFWVACLVMFSVFHFGKPYYTNKDNKYF